MVQTERDSHSVTHYEIHCWIYSIIEDQGSLSGSSDQNLTWSVPLVLKQPALFHAISPEWREISTQDSEFPQVQCFAFCFCLISIWLGIKRPEASLCLRADSLPFGFLRAPLKHFRAKFPPFKPQLEISNLISLGHIKYWELVKPFACLVNLFCVGRTVSQYLPDWLTRVSSKSHFERTISLPGNVYTSVSRNI